MFRPEALAQLVQQLSSLLLVLAVCLSLSLWYVTSDIGWGEEEEALAELLLGAEEEYDAMGGGDADGDHENAAAALLKVGAKKEATSDAASSQQHHHHDHNKHAFGSCPFEHDHHHDHDHDHDHDHHDHHEHSEEWEVTIDGIQEEDLDAEELFRRSEKVGGHSGSAGAVHQATATVFPSVVRSKPSGILKFTPTSYPYYALVPEKTFTDLEHEAKVNDAIDDGEIRHPSSSLLSVASRRSPMLTVTFWYRRPFCGGYCEDAMRLYVDAVSSMRAAINALAGEYPTYSIAYHTPKELVRAFDSAVQFAVVGVRTDSSLDTGAHDEAEVEELKSKYSKFISDKGPRYERIDDFPTITVVGAKTIDTYEDVFILPGKGGPSPAASTLKPRVGRAPEGYTGELTAKDLWFGVVEPHLRRLLEPKCLGTAGSSGGGGLHEGDYAVEGEDTGAPGGGAEGIVVVDDGEGGEGEEGGLLGGFGDDGIFNGEPQITPPDRPPIRPVSGVETAATVDEVFVGEAGLLDLCAILFPLSTYDEVIQEQQRSDIQQEGTTEEAPWVMPQRRMIELFEEATAAAHAETARLRQKESDATEAELAAVLGRLKPVAPTPAVVAVEGESTSSGKEETTEGFILHPKEYTFANGTLNWASSS